MLLSKYLQRIIIDIQFCYIECGIISSISEVEMSFCYMNMLNRTIRTL